MTVQASVDPSILRLALTTRCRPPTRCVSSHGEPQPPTGTAASPLLWPDGFIRSPILGQTHDFPITHSPRTLRTLSCSDRSVANILDLQRPAAHRLSYYQLAPLRRSLHACFGPKLHQAGGTKALR